MRDGLEMRCGLLVCIVHFLCISGSPVLRGARVQAEPANRLLGQELTQERDRIITFADGYSGRELRVFCDNLLKDAAECIAVGDPDSGGSAFAVVGRKQDTSTKSSGDMRSLDVILRDVPGIVSDEFDAPMQAVPEINFAENVDSADVPWNLDRIDDRNGLDKNYTHPDNGGAGVHIYIMDTGIRFSHRDFSPGRAIPAIEFKGPNLVVCNETDNNCAADRDGHGTHCASTAGGLRYGVAKNSTLHSVKVLGDDGSGSLSWLIRAFDWISTSGMRPAVASASLGFGGTSRSVRRAIDRAAKANVTVVVAAGNENSRACGCSPANVRSAITVGATDKIDEVAPYSNYDRCVDIFAPGSGIVAASHKSDTTAVQLSGTSMACPHVSGAAALRLENFPSATPVEVASYLYERATLRKLTKMRKHGTPNRFLYVGDEHAQPPLERGCSAIRGRRNRRRCRKSGASRLRTAR